MNYRTNPHMEKAAQRVEYEGKSYHAVQIGSTRTVVDFEKLEVYLPVTL